ncbi:hypothetical protein FE810_10870 [Thalassotalea litorea]|uniref:DUF883 domain-containing protein n=1 Tax=Thalassotalea litorea TaxID=2020715 RepID=A0A5R9IRQ2_9GAMM|nr:hypothetical protein [Thalassotalea litorea]TLU64588.1 hypothetical protein FE810_10870 [Thalassotalea litorea]
MVESDKASQTLAEIKRLQQQLAKLERDNIETTSSATEQGDDVCSAKLEPSQNTATVASKTAEPLTEPSTNHATGPAIGALNEQQQLEQLMEDLKHELSEHQGASVLGAFALGFLLGRLIR